jgi:hypothetical protein
VGLKTKKQWADINGQVCSFVSNSRHALYDRCRGECVLYVVILEIYDRHYAPAAAISWILSYGVVYAFQKYGTFSAMSREAMLREVGHYAVAVVGLSAAVNFGLVRASRWRQRRPRSSGLLLRPWPGERRSLYLGPPRLAGGDGQ